MEARNIEELLSILNNEQFGREHKHQHHEYVVKDALELLKGSKHITEKEIEDIANLVANSIVYGGDYDCSMTYWQNLQSAIDNCICFYGVY